MTIRVNLRDDSLEAMLIKSQTSRLIQKSRKCVVVTGAGISCNAGIPDFRSENGLYNLVKDRFPDAVVKGKDLFDTVLFSNEKSIKVFMAFMAELRKCILAAKSTQTHQFIKRLSDKGKLLRCYTQNIDGLEAHQGLNIGIPRKPKDYKSLHVVPLHGDIHILRCMLCAAKHSWNTELEIELQSGNTPSCPTCQASQDERERQGKRKTGVGCLRPNIVLYGEEHPEGLDIGSCLSKDLKSKPDLLVIMGTSLKVVGIRKLVKNMAKAVKERGGKVILVNATDLGASNMWSDVIDFHIQGDCDAWVSYLREEIPAFFERQTIIDDYATTKKVLQQRRPVLAPLKAAKANSMGTTADSIPSPPRTPKKGVGYMVSATSSFSSFYGEENLLPIPLTPECSQRSVNEEQDREDYDDTDVDENEQEDAENMPPSFVTRNLSPRKLSPRKLCDKRPLVDLRLTLAKKSRSLEAVS